MGTASLFDSILKSALNIHAAWLPVTNAFELGDYGLVSDGVLVKIGNIRALGVDWSEGTGPRSNINFSSQGTRTIRAVGGAEVNALPDAPLDAKLTIEFERENSFLIKADLDLRQMQNVGEVAHKLYELDAWEGRFRVVSALYTGQQCSVLSSKDANSKIELTGKANALRQFDLGAASADIQVASSEKIGLQIVGQTGVVGLGLFKLAWLSGGPRFLAAEENLKIETTDESQDPLHDDV
jgi:hypothetical protein